TPSTDDPPPSNTNGFPAASSDTDQSRYTSYSPALATATSHSTRSAAVYQPKAFHSGMYLIFGPIACPRSAVKRSRPSALGRTSAGTFIAPLTCTLSYSTCSATVPIGATHISLAGSVTYCSNLSKVCR